MSPRPLNFAGCHGARLAARAPRRRVHGGFALIITIVLVAFLVLLLVGLATFTRVETQVASNAQQQAQARQNALMALNIAVGQLQKYAGPDQRTTARADLQNVPGQNNTQWIGVYGNAAKADYADTPESIAASVTAAAGANATGSPARLLNWLVSGNESAPFDPRRGTGDVGAEGQIVTTPAPASIPFKPAGAVANLAASTTATDPDLSITDASGAARPARLLVGGNSVTSSAGATSQPIDYVVAPAVNIAVPAISVPGAGSTGNVTIGRYAWWIGDEGIKARVNLPLAGTDPTLAASQKLEQQRNAFSNSTRAAVELMASNTPGWAASPPPLDSARIDTLYDHDTRDLLKITNLNQTPFTSSNPAALSAALKYRFHDVSAVSTSVLADTYAGGLKRDLSILLDPSYSPSASDADANTKRLWVKHANDTGGFVTGGGFAIPTWKHLRTFAQTRVPTTGGNAFSVPVTLPVHDKAGGIDDVGAAPVITYFSLGWRAAPKAAPAAGVEIHMNLYPLVVLWNPYNVTLRAPVAQADGSNFEVGIYPSYNVRVALEKIDRSSGSPVVTRIGSFDFQRNSAGAATSYKYIRFRLRCPDIPPGQSLVFSLPTGSSGDLYSQKNILENIEPEPASYVSVPFVDTANAPVQIATGEEAFDYQVNNIVGSDGTDYSSSFRGGGGASIYLGQPDDVALMLASGATTPQTRSYHNPSSANRRWYNTAQQMDWSGLVVTVPFQEPGPLVHDTAGSEPAYVFQTQALFSGQGSNAQLNTNQYMFATRWLAQGNLRAVRSGRTRRDNNYNVLFTATAGQPLTSFPWQKFINGPGAASNRASAGQGHDWLGGAPVDVPVFEFPYTGQPLQSVGQLQHANLSLVGAYPSYPVGNSLADFRLHGAGGSNFPSGGQPAGWQLARTDTGSGSGFNTVTNVGADMNGYYDISYLLNRTLWDRYYFSTVPATGTISPTQTFANPRHIRHDATIDVQNPERSAAALLLAGGFNINSTSEQAWRAVLGGGNHLLFDPENPDSASTNKLKTTFSRFTRPGGDDDPDDAWKGYRSLDENEVAQLARNIVEQIRARGPFVSLSDFVNRRLVDNASTGAEDETYRGPLQAAIDATNTSSSTRFPANDGDDDFWTGDSLISTSGSHVNQGTQYTMGYYSQPIVEGRRLNSTASADAAQRPYGNRSAFTPKYITQADILAKIGAGLSGRSDTFTVRAYGENVNPATGEVSGRAWCEAVVQRLPEYIEDGVNAWDTPAAGGASQTYGRKFKITSFRWLSPDDI